MSACMKIISSQVLEVLMRKEWVGGLVKETEMKRNQYSLNIILIFDKQVPITEFTF